MRRSGPSIAARGARLFVVLLLSTVAVIGISQLPAQAAQATHKLLGNLAPDFALRSTSGRNTRLSEYRGEVVLLTFWGSRCSACRPQLTALESLQSTYGTAGLVSLAVGVDDDLEKAREFAAGLRSDIPLLLDPGKQVARAYDVDALPMTLLIDRAGTVRYLHRDYRTGAEVQYQQELKGLLDE